MKDNAEERPVLSFLLFAVLAFLISWGSGMVLVLSTHASMVNGAHQIMHPIPIPFPLAITLTMIGGFGPFLAAIAVTAWQSGRSGVGELMRQFRRWRVRSLWYAIALLGPALLGLISLILAAISGSATPAHWFSFPRPLRLAGWLVGPWGEEWAGAASPNQLCKSALARWGQVCRSVWCGLSGITGLCSRPLVDL
jgi:hypothetical protein